MEICDSYIIPAPRNVVWKALNDPVVLGCAIPGCKSIEQLSADTYEATVIAKIGPVSAKFKGVLRTTDAVVPLSYKIHFEGSGGGAGFAKGSANVSLVDEGDDQTKLTYTASAKIGGRIAQVGGRLVDIAVKKISDEFFQAFCQAVAYEGKPTSCQPVETIALSDTGHRWGVIAAGISILVIGGYVAWRVF